MSRVVVVLKRTDVSGEEGGNQFRARCVQERSPSRRFAEKKLRGSSPDVPWFSCSCVHARPSPGPNMSHFYPLYLLLHSRLRGANNVVSRYSRVRSLKALAVELVLSPVSRARETHWERGNGENGVRGRHGRTEAHQFSGRST